jgi:hypothetical protein
VLKEEFVDGSLKVDKKCEVSQAFKITIRENELSKANNT